MPLKTGKKQGQCYIKWGDAGHEYFYTCNSSRSYEYAKKKALAQAVVIGDLKLEEVEKADSNSFFNILRRIIKKAKE